MTSLKVKGEERQGGNGQTLPSQKKLKERSKLKVRVWGAGQDGEGSREGQAMGADQPLICI